MPKLAAMQPNGNIAIFSTVSDSFVALNMTRESAVAYFRSFGMCKRDAEEKVQSAFDERGLFDRQKNVNGFRWEYCTDCIGLIHGEEALKELEEDLEK